MSKLPDGVVVEKGPGGLDRVAVHTPLAQAHVYLLGAHVAHYQRTGEPPLLFMSRSSWFEVGKPIRGGVPVCFPWFAQRQDRPDLPNHGLVRQMPWTLSSATRLPDGSIVLTLECTDDANTRRLWPHRFIIRHQVTIGQALNMTLEVTNLSAEPFRFEQALHTYFAVRDIRQVRLHGLEGCAYMSKVEGGQVQRQPDEPIRFTSQTDRVYHGTIATCVIEDPGLNRRITIAKTGSHTTVVWNPWTDKARAMPDFGDDQWPGMLCVETANAGADALDLAPGKSHRMSAAISVT